MPAHLAPYLPYRWFGEPRRRVDFMAGKVAPLVWRKSMRCSTSACVEVATTDAAVHVRDGKSVESPVLTFGPGSWRAFVASLTSGVPHP